MPTAPPRCTKNHATKWWRGSAAGITTSWLAQLVALLMALLMALFAAPAPAQAVVLLRAPADVSELLQRYLPLQTSNVAPDDAGARRTLERMLQRDAAELLATEGYFSPIAQLQQEGDEAVLHITTGPRARVGQVRIVLRGLSDAALRHRLTESWALGTGQPFRQDDWDSAKRQLLDALDGDTYPAARWLHTEARVDVPSQTVDLDLLLDSGPAVSYEAVRVEGLQRYRPATVDRFLGTVAPGQPYRRASLLALQATLQSTPYFQSVAVDIDRKTLAAALADRAPVDTPKGSIPDAPATPLTPDEASAATPHANADDATTPPYPPLRIPLVIQVRERPPYNLALSVGASSNTGARVEASLRNTDLLGRAWDGRAGVRLEQLRQSAFGDVFFLPDGAGGRPSAGVMWAHSNIQGLDVHQGGAALAYTLTRNRVERRVGLAWQQERRTQSDAVTERAQALAPSITWIWRDALVPDDPAEGVVLQVQFSGASRLLASDQNFVRSYARYSQGLPLGQQSSVLLRAELGVTAAPRRDGIPQDYLFRAGGANSVRGYAYQSLGVQQGTATLGGRYLYTVSGELLRWLTPEWGAAAFVDAGQAADDRKALSPAVGYGLGARWKSPAGPLGLDLAWSERDRRLRLHFALSVPI